MPRFNEDRYYKNLLNDDGDLNIERTIDNRSENADRHDSMDPRKKFIDDENDYNLEDEKHKDPEHDFIPIDEIPSEDTDPAEHFDEIEEDEEKFTNFNEIVRKSKGYRDEKGVFHSTEPHVVWKQGEEEKIVKSYKRLSPSERQELIKRAHKRHHREKIKERLGKNSVDNTKN